VRIRACGDHGIIVELDDLRAVHRLYARLEREPLPGVIDLAPASRTLLLHLDPATTTPAEVARRIGSRDPAQEPDATGGSDEVEVPVVYDGADLEEVGELTGLGAEGVVAAHTGRTWTVAFVGFAPGFGYLVADDEVLRVPRRPEPRTAVPAGAVGLADEFSGIYPRRSPGGWQLIGRTDHAVWDLGRDPPSVLAPGTVVRFVVAS
jgi:KipI family sensor histidine kinase inhibitor